MKYFYNWYGVDSFEDIFIGLVDEFEKSHPDIDVELIRGGGVNGKSQTDRLIAMIAAGNSPDIVHFERSQVREFAAKGLLEPLDPYFGSVRDEFVPASVQEVVYNGAVYSIPWGTDIRGLFWNKRDLAGAGYDPSQGPRSLQELDSMAARLTKTDGSGKFTHLGFIPWLGNWYATSWLYAFGGNIYDEANKKPRVNTPNHVKAFEWIQEYGQRYPYDVVAAALSGKNGSTFYDETLSMIAHWNGFANMINQADPNIEFWVGEVPHPSYGSNGAHMGGYSHVIPSTAKNKDDAVRLLKWVGSKEAEIRLYRAVASLPTRWTALNAIRDELSPTDAVLVQQVENAWGRPPLEYPPYYVRLTEAMRQVAKLQTSPKAALDQAQQLLETDFAKVFGE